MHEPDQHDPWASLADSLGVGPGPEPSPPEPVPPARPPAARRSSAPTRKPARPVGERSSSEPGAWDELASTLGLESGDRSRENRQGSERRDRGPTTEERTAGDTATGERSFGMPAPETRRPLDEAGDDREDRRPRRRRGRRGRGRSEDRREEGRRDDFDAPVRPRPVSGDFDDEPVRDDLVGPAVRQSPPDDLWDDAPRSADGPADDAAAPDDEDRPRRRRRRGRRGGRGRSRSTRVGDANGDTPLDDLPAPVEDVDDEPLPGGYGVRPAGRPPVERPREAADGGGDQAAAEGRPRRRRRRRGDGRGRETNGDAASRPAARSEGSGRREGAGREAGIRDRDVGGRDKEGSGRKRRDRRRDRRSDSESRSSSGRGRRTDFAPVGPRYEEDDEGLEFLGIDDSSAPPSRPAEVDDVLVESGLTTVSDVPSWVEAIGIVIAGNLDARNKSGRADDARRHR